MSEHTSRHTVSAKSSRGASFSAERTRAFWRDILTKHAASVTPMPNAEKDAGGKWASRPMFALDADVTVYWPDVRPCYDDRPIPPGKETDDE